MEISSKQIKQWSRLGPRATYGMAMLQLMEENERIYALSADLGGSSGLQRAIARFPNRYLNTGIAEQNLIGIAAGMAREGLVPFASSFAPFITLRCGDQVRMNMGYMNLNIKTVGLGSGVSMGYLGNSHYGIEDLAAMRAIPNLTVISPADCTEIVKAVKAASDYEGPVYIRLTGESGMPIIYQEDFDYQIGKGIFLREGNDIAIVATGSMVAAAVAAAKELSKDDIECSVIDMHTIKPLDREILNRISEKVKLIITLEEHSIVGGLGSAVSEYLAEMAGGPQLLRMGLSDSYLKAGDYQYMLEQYGLTTEKIIAEIKKYWLQIVNNK